MAQHLATPHPLYAFAAPGLNSNAPFFFHLEAMAAAYLQDIRQIQPKGPYLLAGYSMGGILAYEIAQQLQSRGEGVALLAMIDSFAPRPELGKHLLNWARNGLLLQVITNQLALQWGCQQLLPPDALPQLPFSAQCSHAARHLIQHAPTPHPEAALEGYLKRCQQLMRVHAQLLADYTACPLQQPTRVLLFRNTKGLIGQPSLLALPNLAEAERNPPHQWEALLPTPPICIDRETEHFLLGNEEHMASISQTLGTYLKSISDLHLPD